MYIINDIIILCFVVTLAIYLKKNKYYEAIVLATIGYFTLPVIKIGQRGMNSAYAITGLLIIWLIFELLRKKINFTKIHIIFLVLMGISILIVAVAYLLQGNFALSHMIHFLGMLQYLIGVLCISILGQKISDEKYEKALYKAILMVIVWNFVIVILQMFVFDLGYTITELFYTYPGKDLPLKSMERAGRFLRAFGAFYSPTHTGIFCLFATAFFIPSIHRGTRKKENLIFLCMTLFIGLFCFSKVVILGIFFIFVLAIIFDFVFHYKIYLKNIICSFLCIVLLFFVVGCIGSMIGLRGQVDYYFGKIMTPFSVLESRYGDVGEKIQEEIIEKIENNKNETEIEEKIESNNEIVQSKDGNLDKAIRIFFDNPIIGVGPVAIDGEFLGDSQYVIVLHDGGILNFVCYSILYFYIFIMVCKNKNTEQMLILFVIAGSGLATPVLLSGFSIPFVSNLLKSHKKNMIY